MIGGKGFIMPPTYWFKFLLPYSASLCLTKLSLAVTLSTFNGEDSVPLLWGLTSSVEESAPGKSWKAPLDRLCGERQRAKEDCSVFWLFSALPECQTIALPSPIVSRGCFFLETSDRPINGMQTQAYRRCCGFRSRPLQYSEYHKKASFVNVVASQCI